MAFWSSTDASVPEPKRNFRWLLYMGGVPQWVVKKVSKPSFTITEAEHRYLSHKFYYPGAVEWNTVSVTLVDPVSPDATQTIYNIIRNAGYHAPESELDTMTMSKGHAVGSLGMVRLVQIGTDNPGGGYDPGKANVTTNVLEEWFLYNAWVKDVQLGELDYTSDDLSEITLELRYDFAKLNADNESGNTQAAQEAAGRVVQGYEPGSMVGSGTSGTAGTAD